MVGGILAYLEGNQEEAEMAFQEALLFSNPVSWEFLLSRVMLQEVSKTRRLGFRTEQQWTEHAAQTERFEALLGKAMESKRKSMEELAPLWVRLAEGGIRLEEKQAILKDLLAADPADRSLLGALIYCSAALEAWPDALDSLKKFNEQEGRQNALRMSLGLLQAAILHNQGMEPEAEERLKDFHRRVRDPWFLAVCESLQGRRTEASLREQAQGRAEDILTGYTALGFWAEGSKDKESARRYYREALGSFLTDWLEYDFTRERTKRLRGAGD